VGDEERCVDRKANSDIATDLTDPDRFVPAREVRLPQPQMIALMDRPARLLHRDILPPAKKVQRTHRGIAVGVAFEESPNRLPGGSGGKHMRGIPFLARQRSQDLIVSADEDEIYRVAILRALRVSGATGQGFNRAAQLGNRQIGPGRWSRFRPELRPLIVEPAAGQLKKRSRRGSHPGRAPFQC